MTMPRLNDAGGNEYFGLAADEVMDLVDLLARLLEVVDAPALAGPVSALVGPDAGLALGDGLAHQLCELATCIGSRRTGLSVASTAPVSTRWTPTCRVCEAPVPDIGYRRYCSPECRATDWRRRHPDRCDCGAALAGSPKCCPRCTDREAATSAQSPCRGVPAAASCPVCQVRFTPGTNQRYCSKACRDTAWRHRHNRPRLAIVVPDGQPRRPLTVYECGVCGSRTLGEQRCEDYGTFMARVGLGGNCPACDAAVAVADLLDEEVVPPDMS